MPYFNSDIKSRDSVCLKTVLRHILDVLVLVLWVGISVLILVLVLTSLSWASVKTV